MGPWNNAFLFLGLAVPQAIGLLFFITVRKRSKRLPLFAAIVPACLYGAVALSYQHGEPLLVAVGFARRDSYDFITTCAGALFHSLVGPMVLAVVGLVYLFVSKKARSARDVLDGLVRFINDAAGRTRETRAAFFGSVAVLALASCVFWWFATMPYPAQMWLEASTRVPYSRDCQLVDEDFKEAEIQVEKELGFREIIFSAEIIAEDKLRFMTMTRWNSSLSAAGRFVTVVKIEGKWRVTNVGTWIS
ncbi:MAG: hypothetical protein HY897_03300 [Deltaproteobacteria bacterium]|nr:hypothetical protein [Deltaproteobacteria bacterium]